MKSILPLFWAFCLLCVSCKSVPAAALELESGGLAEMPVVPEGSQEKSSGLEAAVEDEIPLVSQGPEDDEEWEELPEPEPEFAGDSTADLPEDEGAPELTLPEPFSPDFFSDAADEFTNLPEPAFSEPAAAVPETVATPFPEMEPRPSEPVLMDEPPVLDISPEPAPKVVQVTPPAAVPAPSAAPVSPPSPAQTPPPKPSPPPVPPRSRPPERSSGITRDPLPLPTVPVPSLPAHDPPTPPTPPPLDEEIEYSRIIRAAVGHTIEIPFRGTGWVYLGELRSRPGVAYNSRRSDAEGPTFIFRAEEAGTFGLKFYKQDYVRDYILNDHVQVIVDDVPGQELLASPGDRGRVIGAPRWPYLPSEEPSPGAGGVTAQAEDSRTGEPPAETALPSGEGAALWTPPAQPSGAAIPQPSPARRPETAAPTPPVRQPPEPQTPAAAGRRPPARTEDLDDDSMVAPPRVASTPPAGRQPALSGDGVPVLPDDPQPEEYFRKAREAFEAGQIQPALATLNQFRERYPLGSDEAWWLYGQLLEAAGPSRDIRSALDYYRRLVREYPQSPRCNDARGRIAYLERFYFNIR